MSAQGAEQGEHPRPTMHGAGLASRAAHAFSRYRAGDTEGMEVLVDLLTPILWHTARAQGLAASPAQDVVQTAWLRLVEQADRLHDPQAVLGWLLVTVKRESWRVARAHRHHGDELGEDVGGPSRGPEEVVVGTLADQHLWRHVHNLDPRCQKLLRVIAFADKPDYAQISQALGMPIGSIGPTRGRCLGKLRLALENDPGWGSTNDS